MFGFKKKFKPDACLSKCANCIGAIDQLSYLVKKNTLNDVDVNSYLKHIKGDFYNYMYALKNNIPEITIDYVFGIVKAYNSANNAYDLAMYLSDINNNDFKYELQEISCKKNEYAFYFAKNIPGADINYCLESMIRNNACDYLANFINKINLTSDQVNTIYNFVFKWHPTYIISFYYSLKDPDFKKGYEYFENCADKHSVNIFKKFVLDYKSKKDHEEKLKIQEEADNKTYHDFIFGLNTDLK